MPVRRGEIGRFRLWFGSVGEGVVDENRVFAFRAGRQQSDRRFDQFLDTADVFDRRRRQVGPGPRPVGAFGPAFHFLEDRLDPRLLQLRGGQVVEEVEGQVVLVMEEKGQMEQLRLVSELVMAVSQL